MGSYHFSMNRVVAIALCLVGAFALTNEELLNDHIVSMLETQEKEDGKPFTVESSSMYFMTGWDNLNLKACSVCPTGYEATTPCTTFDDTVCEELCTNPLLFDPPNPNQESGATKTRTQKTLHGNSEPWSRSKLSEPTYSMLPASNNDAEEWVQIDLKEVKRITGTAMKGRGNANWYTKKFQIVISDDGSNWEQVYKDAAGTEKYFVGNTHHNIQVDTYFPKPVRARYIRYVIDNNGSTYSGWKCLRWALYMC